ncbi:hypothetical protein [Enterobacter sp. R1(2018)]|uniref:hypothetical protein n=1 Tax=Enterobacter sp. R1(2018) TaxID=2447891 RepID=UPI0015FF8ECB|nr:hypothetical protein [Enterobacter sp. R1(2018)]
MHLRRIPFPEAFLQVLRLYFYDSICGWATGAAICAGTTATGIAAFSDASRQ